MKSSFVGKVRKGTPSYGKGQKSFTTSGWGTQLQQSQDESRRRWRPYPNIEHFDPRYDFEYLLTGPETGDTLVRQLSEIKIQSDGYRAVTAVRYRFTRRLRYTNTGATPLRVTHMVSATISPEDWQNRYNKDLGKLVVVLREKATFALQLETDITVQPGKTLEGRKDMGEPGVLSKTYWTSNTGKNHEVVLYPVTYIEYEDFFDNAYDVVIMEFNKLSQPITDGVVVRPDTIVAVPGTERYRWDIAVGNNVLSE